MSEQYPAVETDEEAPKTYLCIVLINIKGIFV